MKNNKRLLSTIAVFAIILVLFTVLVTAVPFNKGAASWVAFSFGVVSIIGSCLITVYAFGKGKNIVCKVYGFSLFKLGVTYLSIQLIASIIVLVLGAFFAVPAWVAVIVGVLVLGLCLIGLLLVDNAIDIVIEQDEKLEQKIKEIKTFTVDVGTIVAICKNDELKPQLEALAEAFRYSDPVSSAKTEPLEANIKTELEALTTLVAMNSENAGAKIKEIEALLSSRNAICKLSK